MSYADGKIYVLKSHQTKDVSFGGTTSSLINQLNFHKKEYMLFGNSINNILRYRDVWIELVEEYPCNNKKELDERVVWWVNNI